ncbi:hypothetical protein [Vibrio sp. Hal054]|uniref:hypothetical protein n=1 Tax=Vibrio sp. Hal054 TaxID=3035158 RepID=UPI00301C29F6
MLSTKTKLLAILCEIELNLLLAASKKALNIDSGIDDLELDVDALSVGYSLAGLGNTANQPRFKEVLASIKRLDQTVFNAYACGFRAYPKQN